MIEWMDNVANVAEFAHETYLMSVYMLDHYLNKAQKENGIKTLQEFYLVGITCIWIASKYEEVDLLSVEAVKKQLGHDQFSL